MPAEDSTSTHSSSISAALGPPAASSRTPITSTSNNSSSLARAELGRQPLRVLVVRGDDPTDQLVSHDVLVAEADEIDALDPAEHVGDDDQAGIVLARQVDLRDVPGDHHH